MLLIFNFNISQVAIRLLSCWQDCRQPFHGGSFFDHEGLPYCETHYHAKRGSLCAGCHKPITGNAVIMFDMCYCIPDNSKEFF